MISKQVLINDKRFYLDEFNIDRLLKNNITDYQITNIKLGKIKRFFDNKISDMEEMQAYKYCNDKEKYEEEYINYCEVICKDKGNSNRTKEEFDKLIDNINENGYDPEKGIIVIDQFNFIQEGQHRVCVLLNKYGKDYEIKVLKIHIMDYGIKTYLKVFLYKLKGLFI